LAVRVDVVRSPRRREVQVLVGNLGVVLTLDLRSRGGQQVDGPRTRVAAVSSWTEITAVVAGHVGARIAGVRRCVRRRR
jgi:hypothetical protein